MARHVFTRLIRDADSVLMDLRGPHADNLSSLHELEALGRADHLGRAVLLIDRRTDVATTLRALGSRPAWISWHRDENLGRCDANAILKSLLQGQQLGAGSWPEPSEPLLDD